MKWMFLAKKATKCFPNSQRYHHYAGSHQRFFLASNHMGSSKSDQIQSSSSYFSHCYNTTTILNGAESSNRFINSKEVDLEIISREAIKPSSPTPYHLRTYNLSIIDQFMYDVYTPTILFFPNTNKDCVMDIITKRSKHLKETLSTILTRFYPFAGKVKNNLQIECNDEGICYTEARVNQTLQEFLVHPDDERVRELMPESPRTDESSIGNYVIGIQINIFKCGGIGLSLSASHKIFDGQTIYMFMKAWAVAARDSQETVLPSFVAHEIFPNNPHLEYSASSKLLATKRLSTKRFVFDSTALALLKKQPVASATSTHPPTRMEATTAIVWKAAAQAASKVRAFGPQSPYALLSVVNLRKKASPPLPKESIGNLIDVAGATCLPHGHLDLPSLIGELRESMMKIDSNHIESMKGEKGHAKFNDILRRLNQLLDVTAEGDCLLATSLLRNGMYELDFGWGKPIWFYIMNARMARSVSLNETLKGGGVEAVVTLSPDEMKIFERDSELLSYASVNPSPLRSVL